MSNSQEYLKGWSDCEKGIPHQSGLSKEYDRGYSDSYQQQVLTEKQTEIAHG